MTRRLRSSIWTVGFKRGVAAVTRAARESGRRMLAQAFKPTATSAKTRRTTQTWRSGTVVGHGGALRFELYRPPDAAASDAWPLVVMLHGCGQDADEFAACTRMNRLAMKERFLVLYPEQGSMANSQRCWNWFDTGHGKAQAEADRILLAIDQVCLKHPADRSRVAVVGLSAGASMAALLAVRHPERISAVVMHSGIPPGTAHSLATALSAMRGQETTHSLGTGRQQGGLSRLPPLLAIHGDADAMVSPKNAVAAVHAWAEAAQATAGPTRRIQRGQRRPMDVTDHKREGKLVATLAMVSGLAHAWSGGAEGHLYSDAKGPDASRMAWSFAKALFAKRSADTPMSTMSLG